MRVHAPRECAGVARLLCAWGLGCMGVRRYARMRVRALPSACVELSRQLTGRREAGYTIMPDYAMSASCIVHRR